jgi:hypothetical protein
MDGSVIPKNALFAPSIMKSLAAKPRTAAELCGASAAGQRRRWAALVKAHGTARARQQINLDLQALKRFGHVERVKLMGRCDLWRLASPTWGKAFEMLPRKTKQAFVREAYERKTGLFIVERRGKLVGIPRNNVLAALAALDIKVKAELILLGVN